MDVSTPSLSVAIATQKYSQFFLTYEGCLLEKLKDEHFFKAIGRIC